MTLIGISFGGKLVIMRVLMKISIINMDMHISYVHFQYHKSLITFLQQHTLLYTWTKSPSCLASIRRRSFSASFLLGTTTLKGCCRLHAALFRKRSTRSYKGFQYYILMLSSIDLASFKDIYMIYIYRKFKTILLSFNFSSLVSELPLLTG